MVPVIPGEFAFCIPAAEGHVCLSVNRNPQLAWADVRRAIEGHVLASASITGIYTLNPTLGA